MVSHSLNSLKEFCDIALFVGRDNRISYYQNIDDAINAYKEDEGLTGSH